MVTVRALEERDIAAAALVSARAFRNNSAMVGILRRDPPERERLLNGFGRTLLSIYNKHGQCWVVSDEETICAAMLTLPQGSYPLPWSSELRLGAECLVRGGLSTTARFSKMDAFVKRRHPSHPHHYVYMLATDPDHQRRGFGSMLLSHLGQAFPGIEIYLETDEPDNLPFYQSNGFDVIGEDLAPIGQPPFPIWYLHKKAK